MLRFFKLVLHASIKGRLTHVLWVLMVESQIINLTPHPSFGHSSPSSQLQMENVISIWISTLWYLSNNMFQGLNLDHIYYLPFCPKHFGIWVANNSHLGMIRLTLFAFSLVGLCMSVIIRTLFWFAPLVINL